MILYEHSWLQLAGIGWWIGLVVMFWWKRAKWLAPTVPDQTESKRSAFE